MLAVFSRANARTRGILCIIGAAFFLTANDSIIKWLSPTYPLHEIVLVRAVTALTITLLLVQLEGGFRILRTRRPALHLLRGLLIVVANMAFFLGLASLPLAEATALFFVAPLFITALSVFVLGEPVGPRRWLAVAAGLLGVVVMLRPGLEAVRFAAFLPLVAALAYASMQMLTRRLGVTDKASTLAFYVQLTFVVVAASIGLAIGDGRFGGGENATLEFFFRAWLWPTRADALLMVLCGSLIAVGGYLMSQAYRTAEAAVVAPFEYSAMPLAVFWGFQLWGQWPDPHTFLGIALIVGGGLFVFYRESVHKRLVAAERPMPPDR
jgi:drug/metabolite transporter (DMT)-like permease